jgi:[acyl-carrier-protein] S-malonyltransferase
MTAFVFPGQGAQFSGMGKELYDAYPEARTMMQRANEVLGFNLTEVMFEGTDEALRQTRVTQPAIFLHSIVAARLMTTLRPDMVAGHSLGEFSALVAAQAISWEDGLRLVSQRAQAMQEACEICPGTMAAVLGLPDDKVIEICQQISGFIASSPHRLIASNCDNVAVAANFNCPGQVVISGSLSGVDAACKALKEAGAKRALKLPVGGAFHSPLMQPAAQQLESAILATTFRRPICPVYQNVSAHGETDPLRIQQLLLQQLTSPVRWTQSVQQMIADGATHFYEFGPGDVLKGLIHKINPDVQVG